MDTTEGKAAPFTPQAMSLPFSYFNVFNYIFIIFLPLTWLVQSPESHFFLIITALVFVLSYIHHHFYSSNTEQAHLLSNSFQPPAICLLPGCFKCINNKGSLLSSPPLASLQGDQDEDECHSLFCILDSTFHKTSNRDGGVAIGWGRLVLRRGMIYISKFQQESKENVFYQNKMAIPVCQFQLPENLDNMVCPRCIQLNMELLNTSSREVSPQLTDFNINGSPILQSWENLALSSDWSIKVPSVLSPTETSKPFDSPVLFEQPSSTSRQPSPPSVQDERFQENLLPRHKNTESSNSSRYQSFSSTATSSTGVSSFPKTASSRPSIAKTDLEYYSSETHIRESLEYQSAPMNLGQSYPTYYTETKPSFWLRKAIQFKRFKQTSLKKYRPNSTEPLELDRDVQSLKSSTVVKSPINRSGTRKTKSYSSLSKVKRLFKRNG